MRPTILASVGGQLDYAERIFGVDCEEPEVVSGVAIPAKNGKILGMNAPAPSSTPLRPKLSDAQKRVMKWLGYGWTSEPGAGSSIMVNGKRICNVDTMTALSRAGLARQNEHGCWEATEEGRAVTGRLCL
jgi:hypothetical protein